jgi:hypothetical protein
MMAIIESEETLTQINALQFSGGNMEEKAASSYINRINDRAFKRSNRKEKVISSSMRNAVVSSAGISVMNMNDAGLDPKYKKTLFPFTPPK